jgi:hypothetical protein
MNRSSERFPGAALVEEWGGARKCPEAHSVDQKPAGADSGATSGGEAASGPRLKKDGSRRLDKEPTCCLEADE